MNFDEARQELENYLKMKEEEQERNKDMLLVAFEVFWRSNPNRNDFGSFFRRGLVWMPEMHWIMAKVH